MKPNFLVIGAQKSGTTSLCDQLSQHPQVFMCDPMEPHFFSADEVYGRGWQWYAELFQGVSDEVAIGEGSTSYTMHMHRPAAPKRIAENLPDARLIYVVRHPLSRIESNYQHLRFTRRKTWGLGRTLRENPYMVNTSLYWRQINYYRDHFPDKSTLVLFLEDLKNDPQTVQTTCFRFLGVDSEMTIENVAARNVSLGRRVDNRLGAMIRRSSVALKTGRMLPETVRHQLLRATTWTLKERPTWDRETWQWVVDQVAPDAEQFLQFHGKPTDYWRFDYIR